MGNKINRRDGNMEKRPETAEKKKKLTTKELVILSLLSALLFIGQVGMSFVPNIEVVSLLVYIYTQIYRKKAFLIIYVFVFLEGCVYGFGIWWLSYLYLWSFLALIVLLMKKRETPLILTAVILAAYGLIFGALCSIPYFLSGGWAAGFSYWVAGIPMDLVHCIGNAVVALLFYKPIHKLIDRLAKDFR